MNPLEHKPYKVATLRQSLSTIYGWEQHGVAILDHFDIEPAHKYTTLHNIIKWTKRTIIDSVIDNNHEACARACHIIKYSEMNLINKQKCLFE
jgi:hypothetical protein